MANTISGIIATNGLGYVKANIDSVQFDKIKMASKSTTIDKPVQSYPDSNVWVAGGSTENWNGSINAVDIDWNGAKPGMGEDSTNGITTTDELMKGVYSPMFAKVA